MKSLEIVNERIEQVGKRGKVHLFSFETTIDEKDLQEIKQDLEVLEIIRKKEVCVREVIHLCKGYLDMETALYIYNDNKDSKYHLTMEELLKLKQWLEKEEN